MLDIEYNIVVMHNGTDTAIAAISNSADSTGW